MAYSKTTKSESVRIYLQDALQNGMRMLNSVGPSQRDDKPASSFIHFPKLPIELRLIIWKLALPDTRIITLKQYQAKIPHIEPNGYAEGVTINQLRIRVIASTPVLLHTSRESRALTLEFYTLFLASLLHGRPIYIDYQRDAIYLEHGSTLSLLYLRARWNGEKAEQEIENMEGRLRCLIINTITDPYMDFYREYGLSKFNRLQSLIFVFQSNITDLRPDKSWYLGVLSTFKRNESPVRLVQIIRDLERVWKALGLRVAEIPEFLIGEYVEDGEFIIRICNVSVLPSHLLHLANIDIQEAVRSELEHMRATDRLSSLSPHSSPISSLAPI
jgi:hypothetical protein